MSPVEWQRTLRRQFGREQAFVLENRGAEPFFSDFVAKGTIEEGMLSVLSFKRSLSAGILDGGLGEVALGGSRLDPWATLLEAGTQLFSPLLARGSTSAPARSWIERDPATGARRLRLPLPPPETAQRLADALSGMADLLRGGGARTP